MDKLTTGQQCTALLLGGAMALALIVGFHHGAEAAKAGVKPFASVAGR